MKSAAAIIRMNPNKPAKDVVAICAKEGIKTSLANVYWVRTQENKKAKGATPKRRGRPPGSKNKPRAPSRETIESATAQFAETVTRILRERMIEKVRAAI